MELGRGRGRRRRSSSSSSCSRGSSILSISLCCCCCCFFALSAMAAETATAATAANSWGRTRKPPAVAMAEGLWRRSTITAGAARGRSLLGPGSYPPRCSSKCGDCTPCRPVHVAVPPGTPVLTEYYPEAWRCKCGDRLYMP